MSELRKKVGKYEVRGLVGKGAMGVVYSAVDPALGRHVAIKTMSIGDSPHEAEMKVRFLREGRSAGRIQHPNVITVHELFEEAGTVYLVMELLEGASLSSLIRRKKKLGLGERLSIVDQIAAGLSEAHAHGIVHRDLKPSNVFVLRSGVVKVLDFGVAKVGEGELTKAGTVFGTVEYMAPEQVRGASVSPRADIFSLGVVAYEILAGKNPFRADTLAASVFKIVSDQPEKLEGLPTEVNEVVFRALQKNEGERFASLVELREALAKAAESVGVTLRPPELVEEDVVVGKDKASSELIASIEPRVSQWSNVAAQADLLEELYRQGVAAFNEGRYDECIERMSQVLDEVPVHTMSLHYLAMSEEKRRRERFGRDELARATAVLQQMRDAHRRGDAAAVLSSATELLKLDKESLEARWYRRHAEARLRAASVGVSKRQAQGSMASRVGAPGRSFGYVPPERPSAFGPPAASLSEVRAPSAAGSGANRGLWALVGVAALFLSLLGLWLGSIGNTPPSVSADPSANPVEIPGVRTSPFDEIDEDGTVVLQLPRASAPAFAVERTIPTGIPSGRPILVGLFGTGFTEETTARADEAAGTIHSVRLVSPGHLELEVEVEAEAAQWGGALEIVLVQPEGAEARVTLEVIDSN